MSSETIQCPTCGEASLDHQWCDHCGSPLDQDDAHAHENDDWLKSGDTFQAWCSLHELDVAPYGGEILIEFEITHTQETSSVRHIFEANAIDICDFKGMDDEEEFDRDQVKKEVCAKRYTIEELSELLSAHQEETPEELSHLVRIPAGEHNHNSHTVLIFSQDGSLTLEEYVMARHGQLEYKEVKEIFLSLLDLCEQLHYHNYLYLRLSPWTLRVVQQRDSSGEIVAGIGAEETFVEEDEEEQSEQEEPSSIKQDEPAEELPVADDAPTVGEVPQESVIELPDTIQDLTPPSTGTNPNFPAMRETTQLAQVAPIAKGRVSRALLDGGARFYQTDGQYSELPVVMGFSPTEMFGRTQVPLAPGYDIFSMGMILYYLTSGQLPPTSIYTRHTPAVPSRHFRPDFPIGFQSVINRATRADIQERFVDFAAMREAFERACELIEARIACLQHGEVPHVQLSVERHIGIGKRLRNPVNQDNVFGATSTDQKFALLVVADGVSPASYGSGDLASQYITDVATERWPEILALYTANQDIDEFEIIYSLLDEANQRIVAHVNDHFLPFHGNPHEVMGTTTLIAVIHNGLVTLGSLGDSRAYLQRGTSFEQITIDHNLWTLSILDGVPADNALSLPHSEALARCLGTFYVEHEQLYPISPQPDIFRFPIISGDTLLLATDGLLDFAGVNNTSSEDNTLATLLSEPNPDLAALELILLANRGGGGDNIGIGLAKLY